MITYGGRFKVTLEVYHGVPRGWSEAELVTAHRDLGGAFPITGPKATEPGAPNWLPDRVHWLQYRRALYRIIDGVRAHDAACIALAIRFIELRYIGSYSGFIRARMANALKHEVLSSDQKKRLNRVFISIVRSKDYTEEFNSYAKLWRRIAQADALKLIQSLAAQQSPTLRWKWLRQFENNSVASQDQSRSPDARIRVS